MAAREAGGGRVRRLSGLLLLLTVLLVGCTNPPPPPPVPNPPPRPTELVIGVDDLGAGFNPHLLAHLSPVTTALATLVLPSVFRPDASGALQLDRTVATSAKVVSTEPFTVSYELNLEASWTTNTPIAAEDFVYLWERMRGEPGVADAAGYRLITEVRSRAGGKAVDVVFSEPYPAWPRLFADLLPAHLLKDAPGSWTGATINGLPASGGPFRIVSVDRARGEIVLGRNDLYWDTPSVLDQLVLRRLDPATMAGGLANGDVDVALPESDDAVRTALGGLSPPPHLQPAPQPTLTQLGMRSDSGPLADQRARQGIAAIIDREAIRAAVSPGALPADAYGLAPSQPGYASTAPATAPARPDPVQAGKQLAAAGWSRSLTDGRWTVDGSPARLVIGAAAERASDVQVAELVARQLDAAGIDTTVVAPSGVDLFALPTVTAVPPSSTSAATPGSSTAPVTSTPATSTSAASTPATASSTPNPTGAPPTTEPGAPGGVQVDLIVLPRTVGGDTGTELASDFGCPVPTAVVAAPPRSPTGFCSPTLQPLLDELVSADPQPDALAAVERTLWNLVPVLPLFQPVTLVVSTPATDALTGIGPGPLATGPTTGAEHWRPPPG
jgi:ABC-type transport system substrate-binding protein